MSEPLRPAESATAGLVVRALAPGDVESLCKLLTESFRREYEEQGLDVWGFRRHYRLVAWANRVLVPLGLDFFQVSVAVDGRDVKGTLASFRADAGAWYQGFGAVAPELRGRGVYKRLIRRTLEQVAARGGRVGGGEIRIDNQGALRPYRDAFGTEVLPLLNLFLAKPEAIPEPAVPVALKPISAAELDRLPEAPRLRARFRGGFLVERELRRGLVSAVVRWLLPPLTVASYALVEEGRLAAFARVRTHWPGRIRALDVVYFAPEMSHQRARDALLTVLARYKRKTPLMLRVYVEQGDARLEAICRELGFRLLAAVYPIRTDVAAALARTDAQGRPLAPEQSPATGASR